MMQVLFVFAIFLIHVQADAQEVVNTAKWEGSRDSKAYRELSVGYLEAMSFNSEKSPIVMFDKKMSAYTIFNGPSKKWIYLASKNSIYDRKISPEELKTRMIFTSGCDQTHVDISLHDSSPNGAGVYLDNTEIGNGIKNGRFSFRTMGICRETKLNIEVSKSKCSTTAMPYTVPISGPAEISKAVSLECPKRKK